MRLIEGAVAESKETTHQPSAVARFSAIGML